MTLQPAINGTEMKKRLLKMKLNGKISEAESVEVGHTKGANIAN